MHRLLRATIATALCALVEGCAHRQHADDRNPHTVVFEGMCDASGGFALSDRLLVVADDEDNVLRTYDVERGGPPLSSIDLSPMLGLPPRAAKRKRFPELDLEAATLLGDRAWWLSSHGRNARGVLRPERLRFFATTAAPDDLRPVGRIYEGLLDDLLAEPALARFRLEDAAQLARKAPGGLNIEGLTATPAGDLLIAFRNPVPGGRALLVPILNAGELVEGPDDARARFGAPILLELGGDGVRSLSWWRGRYLIVAGHYDAGGTSRLYAWSGEGEPALLPIDLEGLNPEGFFTPETRGGILLLSDDGSREIDGVPCKELRDEAKKRFRGRWVVPPIPR